MKTENTADAKPPYVSYKTFKNTIESLRVSGLPNRVDRSLFPGLSGAAQSFLLGSFKFLGLIDNDGAPTSILKELCTDKPNEKTILAKIVKEKYSFIFGGKFNFNSATDAQLTEEFKEQGLNGSTIIKAISFLTSVCESAGIPTSPHLKSKRASVPSVGGTPRRTYRKRKNVSDDEDDAAPPAPPAPAPPAAKTFQDILLAKFPDFNPTWDADTQKKWFDNFEKFMASVKKPEQ